MVGKLFGEGGAEAHLLHGVEAHEEVGAHHEGGVVTGGVDVLMGEHHVAVAVAEVCEVGVALEEACRFT